jgi:predicted nucleic acid-binding protein
MEHGAPLLTADARLARAADSHTDVRVILAG